MDKVFFKKIDEMTGREFFCVERLRSLTFVTEQKITLPELDDEDLRAIHVYILNKDQTMALAACRIFQGQDGNWMLGRVVVSKEMRGQHLGKKIVAASEEYVKNRGAKRLSCHAQLAVEKFYENMGYQTQGEIFDEGGVKHIFMYKTL